MNFVRFLENQYQELRWSQSCREIAEKPFNALLDSEMKAAHDVLQGYRTFLKWCCMPKLILHYLFVNLKLAKKPTPILMEKAREKKMQEEAAKKLMEDINSNIASIKPDGSKTNQVASG